MRSAVHAHRLLALLAAALFASAGCYLSHERAGPSSTADAATTRDAGTMPRDAGATRVDADVPCAPGTDLIAHDYEPHFAQLAGVGDTDGVWLVGSPGPVTDEPAPMLLYYAMPSAGAAPDLSLVAEIRDSEGFQVVDVATLGSRIAILAGHPTGRVALFVHDRLTTESAMLAVPDGSAPPTYGAVALTSDRIAVTAMSSDPDVFPYLVTTRTLAPVGTGTLAIASTVGTREGRLVAASYTRESSRLHLRLFDWAEPDGFVLREDIGFGLTVGRWADDVYVAYGGPSIVLLTPAGREDLPPVPGASSFYGLPSIARAPEGYFAALSTSAGLFIGTRATSGWTWHDMRETGGYQVAFARRTSRGVFALSVDFAGRDTGRLLYRGLCDAS